MENETNNQNQIVNETPLTTQVSGDTMVSNETNNQEINQEIVNEVPLTTPTVIENSIEPENNNKKKFNKNIIIIIVIILVVLIAGISSIVVIKNNNNKKDVNTTTTSNETIESSSIESSTQSNETTTTTYEEYTSQTTTTAAKLNKESYKNETITLSLNNKQTNITLDYYYESPINYLIFEDHGFEYINGYYLVLEIKNNNTSYGRYIICEGRSKDEISNIINKKKLSYKKEDLVRTIKDKKNNEDYLFITVPVDVNGGAKRDHVTTPVIYKENGEKIVSIKTAYDEYGYTYIQDSKYNITNDSVQNNRSAYYFDKNNNEIYYVIEMECPDYTYDIVADIKKLTVENGKAVIITYKDDVLAEGVGASC